MREIEVTAQQIRAQGLNAEATTLISEASALRDQGELDKAQKKFDKARGKLEAAYQAHNLRAYNERLNDVVREIEVTAQQIRAKALNQAINRQLEEIEALDRDESIGRLGEALNRYEALGGEKGRISTFRNSYQMRIEARRALEERTREINNAIAEFNRIIELDLNEDTYRQLQINHKTLGHLADNGMHEDSRIIYRMHLSAIRIARYELTEELQASDTRKLKQQIINLLKNEVSVLEELGITGGSVKDELSRLEREVHAVRVEGNSAARVTLEGLGDSAIQAGRRAENQAQEVLLQPDNLVSHVSGKAVILRENLISAAIEEYTVSGMNQLLSLRLKGLAQVLPATVFYSVNQSLDLDKLTELTEQIQLVPLLIPVDRDASSYHWVGLVIKKGTNNVAIAYLDSENDLISIESREDLINSLTIQFRELYPDAEIAFRIIDTEQQCYNNCGPELIENFIHYLTGERVTQETAIYLHSLLYENVLLDPENSASQITDNNLMIQKLSNQVITINKMIVAEGVLEEDSNPQVTSIKESGSNNIFLQSNEGRNILDTTLEIYGLRAFGEMVELGEDEEVANTILDQVQEQGIVTILDAFFEATTKTAISKFETIIIVENNRNQVGLYQYFWDALSNNYLTKSAQNLIEEVNYLYTQVQRLIEEGQDYGNKFLILSSSLEFLLDFAESGQKLPIFRPPYHPDDHGDHRGSGGSGGGSYFEGGGNNMNNDGGDIFLNSLNISVYYAGINNSLDNEI